MHGEKKRNPMKEHHWRGQMNEHRFQHLSNPGKAEIIVQDQAQPSKHLGLSTETLEVRDSRSKGQN